jgi:hypothetical protein
MEETAGHRSAFGKPWWIFLIGFLVIAATMNWEEHKAHFLGILPYLFLLSCPLMHLFMHRGHESHGQDPDHHEHHHSQTENPGVKP